MNVANALWPLARLSPLHNQLLTSPTGSRVPTLPKATGLMVPAQVRPAPGAKFRLNWVDRIRPVVGDRDRVVVVVGAERGNVQSVGRTVAAAKSRHRLHELRG